MERIPQAPPTIKPLPHNAERPTWSVMIPAYNCSRYLAETLESVLSQCLPEEDMQIEIIDDHSTDADVSELVQRIGKGRVKYFRQPKNMGSLRNFETCINRALGHRVHILHGDDKVESGFYNEIDMLFQDHPEAGAAFTDFYYMDENGVRNNRLEDALLQKPGILPDWLSYIAQRQRVQPPAMVVKRSVYEQLGSFYAVHYGEDWEMWARIAANYPVAHSPERLASYRSHETNISSTSILTGQNIRDINTVIKIIQTYLPEESRKALTRQARMNFAYYFAKASHVLYHDQGNLKSAFNQAKNLPLLHFDRQIFKSIALLLVKIAINYRRISGRRVTQKCLSRAKSIF